MRPLLASLALLLLALCSEIQADSEFEDLKGTVDRWKELLSIPGAHGLLDTTIAVEEKKKRRTSNGVLCAFEEHPNLADEIKQITDGITQEQENSIAASMGIKCNSTSESPEWKCFCAAGRKNIFYCGALKLKNKLVAEKFQKTTCPQAALASLKTLSTYFETNKEELSKDVATSDVAKLSKNEDSERARFFCNMADPATTTAMKAFFESDLYPSQAEKLVIMSKPKLTNMYNQAMATCSNSMYVNTHTRECICEDRGFLFCPFYAIGKFFVEEGYLKCDGAEKKFDKSKRPTELDLKRPINGGGSKGDSNKDKAAATSSLLVPLAAAAAMLLRH